MGFLSLKDLVDKAKKNGRKKKSIGKNLKSKGPQLLVFATVSGIPELLGHLGSRGKDLFSSSAASQGTALKVPPVRRSWRYRGWENPGWEGRKEWEWQGGRPYLAQALSFPSVPTLSPG